MKSKTSTAKEFLETGANTYYRDVATALCGNLEKAAEKLVQAVSFDDFLNKAGAKSEVYQEPFPIEFTSPPQIQLAVHGSHIDFMRSPSPGGEAARYLVFTSKHIFLNPTAHAMFSKLHEKLLAGC